MFFSDCRFELEADLADAIALKRSERQRLERLERLARQADCTVDQLLRDVLRDGFDYTEYKIKALNEGVADVAAGQLMSLDELKARIERRRAQRGRVRRKAA